MDHKLKIFKAVAHAQSFSRAAKLLHISQPAVSKCIQGLEEKYGKAFFERKANSIELTSNGKLFLAYAEKILQAYTQLESEFEENKTLPNEIKIGASTTIANYVLPQLLGPIQKDNPNIEIEVIIGNTFDIQQAVLKKEINLGIVEGDHHNTRLHYTKFIKDELILVSKYSDKSLESLALKKLAALPLISRELGSGTKEVIENALQAHNLTIAEHKLILGSTESIKNYLLNSNMYAFLSVHSIRQELKEQSLRIIDIDQLEITRWFYFITRQGFQSKQADKIQKLLRHTYNQKE